VREFVERVYAEWSLRRQRSGSGVATPGQETALVLSLLLHAVWPSDDTWIRSAKERLQRWSSTPPPAGDNVRRGRYELLQLSTAFWDVLSTSGIPLHAAMELMARADDLLQPEAASTGPVVAPTPPYPRAR
jgi:hypothetical protein